MKRQHQLFASHVAAGKSHTEAYLLAYPGCSKDAARKNAPRLMTNEDVQSETQRLGKITNATLEKQSITQRTCWLEHLATLVEKAEAIDDFSVAVRALVEIGKAQGFYSPQKMEVITDLHGPTLAERFLASHAARNALREKLDEAEQLALSQEENKQA